MTADNSIISEIHAEKSLNKICNVWRCAVLPENYATYTSTLLKCWNDMVAQKRFIEYTIDSTGNRTCRTYPFENEWPYDKQCSKPAPLSYFFRMKRYWLMTERIFRCPYFTILSVDLSILTKGNVCVRVCVCVRCPDESITLTAIKFGTHAVVIVTECTSKPEF
ncbi:hypothetical protein AVEN_251039-1 [Araneus ventricosus]|uniref:Uncharacterized protein n=1 Tax=Araneus ventricosus TaxID=182803 RepID=A0A4Y2DJY6_ARAVE|nr:hypothetical protein AVEN_251039-1 [Araneus ventricosus]